MRWACWRFFGASRVTVSGDLADLHGDGEAGAKTAESVTPWQPAVPLGNNLYRMEFACEE